MKSIINIINIICVLGLALGFTACSDKYEYSPAEVPTSVQVYFPSTLPQQKNLLADMTVTSFDVELRRIDKESALTVNLTVENENPDIFTIPTSASFAAGSDVTVFTIDYDPNELDFGDYKPISIAISDISLTTPYGASVYSFSAGIPEPWKTLGKATLLITDFLWVEDDDVELQQHEIDPTRYRLVEPFANREMYYSNVPLNDNAAPYLEFRILPAGSTHTTFNREDGTVTVNTTVDGLVFFEPAAIGVSINDTEMGIWHPVSRVWAQFDSRDEQNWLHNIVTQWSADGQPEVVQLSPYFVVLPTGGAYTDGQDDGVITIIFPGVELVEYDYSINLKYLGHYIDGDDVDNAIVQFTKGADAAIYKYVVVDGVLTSGAAGAIADEIVEGTIPTEEDTESGYKIFPFTDAGTYSVVVVTFDEEGEAQEFSYVSFEFIPAGMDNPWVSLGFCQYTDDVLAPLFGAPAPTYEVEILEHRDTPGLFRLKNAYGEDYPYNDPGDYDEGNVYIEINATDPDGVYIDFQSMGVDWGYGTMYIYSLASYNMDDGETFEDVKAEGVCGTYKDDIITFPADALLLADDDGLYGTNEDGLWKVDMTTLISKSSLSKLSSKSFSSKNDLTRSANKVKSPSNLSKNSILPIRVKGKNVPAPVIRNNMMIPR